MYRHQRKILALVAVLMVGLGVGIPLGGYLSRTPVDGGPIRPSSYQILYRTGGTSGQPVGWEQLTVQRPFRASDLDFASPPGPSATPTGGSVFTKDQLFAFASGAFQLVSDRQPGVPGFDQDLVTQLGELQSRHLAVDLHQRRTLAGRACQMYRFHEPPSGAVAELSGPGHDDLCLDRQGLILSEQWTLEGHIALQRRATTVAVGQVTPSAAPRGNFTLPSNAVASAHPDPSPRSFLPSPVAPPGFTGGPPESVTEVNPQAEDQLLSAEVIWSFTKGPDVITVEAGESPPGRLPWTAQTTVTRPITLTRLGGGRSAIRSDGAELRLDMGDGQWIRIRGTVPLAGLIAYANTLTPPV
jgi:hypothetical protein